jgi:hypothetical protein
MQEFNDLVARGWVRFALQPAVPGETTPQIGYRKAPAAGTNHPLSPYVSDAKGVLRVEIYDQPDGQFIGYLYSGVGFVTKATGDDPSFDVRALYASKGICTRTDHPCDPPVLTPPPTVRPAVN